MQRQVVLDTETTGIRVEDGHRIIEIGCVELINRKLTGHHFHCYLNPGRDIDAGAIAIHGLTSEFLKDKPLFAAVAKDFIDFIRGAELIIHNAPFDLGFIDYELSLLNLTSKKMIDLCRVIDTLPMARSLHVGQRNNLDALCKRYHIDHSKREFHGALLDAHLLAQVYLAMTGGQGSFFETLMDVEVGTKTNQPYLENNAGEKIHLVVLKANDNELEAHRQYLNKMQEKTQCLWLEMEKPYQ